MSRKTWIGSALVLTLLLAGAFGCAAFADTAATDNGTDKMQAAYQTFITKLADHLAIDEATLESALDATQKEILAEQVAAGTITQEQADAMAQHGFNFGCLGGPGAGGPPPDGQGGPGGGPGGTPPGSPSTSSTNS